MILAEIKLKIEKALDDLYSEDKDYFLIREGLCERCINHRFSIYLENQNFGKDYHVDCEYNKSHLGDITKTKRVSSINGNYIDIVITKRDGDFRNDLACFEVKRWDKYRTKSALKDRTNLEILTGGDGAQNNIGFGYDYGFYIIFGKKRDKTKIEIYKNGCLAEKNYKIKNEK